MKVVSRKGGGNDIRPMTSQSVNQNHSGGRRQGAGSGVVGRSKGQQLGEARATSLGHKRNFRAGIQDARSGAMKPGNGPTGPVSPSALQVKTRRRGNGPVQHMPPAHAA
jgi:hypothetical protein